MLKYIYSKYLLQVKIEPPKVSLIKKELAWLLRAFLIGTVGSQTNQTRKE